MNLYIADTHLHHENIIHHCKRPFRSVREMDEVLLLAMLEAEEDGATIFHLGDLAFKPDAVVSAYGGLRVPARHTLIAGNHDRLTSKRPEVQAAYRAFAGRIIGTEATWRTNSLLVEDELDGQPVRILLSHAPQQDLQGADFNLFGHCHNNNVRHPERFVAEYPWLANGSMERHFNVSVELNGYRPVALAELLARRAAGEQLL